MISFNEETRFLKLKKGSTNKREDERDEKL